MTDVPEFALNFFDPAIKADPYPLFKELRSAGRIVSNPFLLGQFMVTHHAEVSALFSDPESFGMGELGQNGGELMAARTMLNTDPPDHERLRGVVARAFTARSVNALEGRCEEIANGLVAPLYDGASYDVVTEIADRLPVLIIAELLGVATSDLDDFVEWSHGLMGGLSGGLNVFGGPSAERDRAIQCSKLLHEYFAVEVERRRSRSPDHTSNDLVGRLVEANADGRLTDDEMLSACVLLLLGGNETTAKLITNGALALARHPNERRRLVDDPSLMTSAIEECLRYDTPVQGDPRVTLKDVEFAGVQFPKGSLLVGLLGCANRDPAAFPDPDRFDISRDPNPHVSFGRGIHYCLGANLARIEARAAIGAILRAAPEYALVEPDEGFTYEGTFFFHAPSKLVIEEAA